MILTDNDSMAYIVYLYRFHRRDEFNGYEYVKRQWNMYKKLILQRKVGILQLLLIDEMTDFTKLPQPVIFDQQVWCVKNSRDAPNGLWGGLESFLLVISVRTCTLQAYYVQTTHNDKGKFENCNSCYSVNYEF